MSFFTKLKNAVFHGRWGENEVVAPAPLEERSQLKQELDALRQRIAAMNAPSAPVAVVQAPPVPPPPATAARDGSFSIPPGAFSAVTNSEGVWSIGPAPDYVVYVNGRPTGGNAMQIKKVGDTIYLGGAGGHWFRRAGNGFVYSGTVDPDVKPIPEVPVVAWPRIITVDGVRVMAKAPINDSWKASMAARLFGSQGGSYVFDPANGDEARPPQPLRSPSGFPIRYTIADGHVVGTGTIIYGDNGFNSDAEIVDWLRRSGESAANLAQLDSWATVHQRTQNDAPTPLPSPPAPSADLASSYQDRAALEAAISSSGTKFGVLLDGVVLHEGFARDNGQPYEYVQTTSGVVLQ